MAKKNQTKKEGAPSNPNPSSRKSTQERLKKLQSDPKSVYQLPDGDVEELLMEPDQRGGGQDAIIQDALIAYFGEEEYIELRELAIRSRQTRATESQRVLILPGIMGSKLGRKRFLFNDLLWIDPIDTALGNLKELNFKTGASDIESIGVFLFGYLKLKLYLRANGFSADYWHFDWRKSIDDLGKELAGHLKKLWDDDEIEEVKIVAHSMGGLVSRMALKHLQSSKSNLSEKTNEMVRQIVLLGTPNYGSFAPMVACEGEHKVINGIAKLAGDDSVTFMEDIGTSFPGLFEMMPFRTKYTKFDFYKNNDFWSDVSSRPEMNLMKAVPAIHKKLDMGEGDVRFTMIAGVNQMTVVDVQKRDDEKYDLLLSPNGDGTVPLDFAVITDKNGTEVVKTFYTECSHGSLPNNRNVMSGVISILRNEKPLSLDSEYIRATDQLITLDQHKKQQENRDRSQQSKKDEVRFLLEDFVAPSQAEGMFASSSKAPVSGENVILPTSEVSREPVRVSRTRQYRVDLHVARGSITELDTRAIVVGVFGDVTPTGAAHAVDMALDGAITEIMQRRMFHARIGEVFILPTNRSRIPAETVILLGLGEFDSFTDNSQRLACEQVIRTLSAAKIEEFGIVLIGAGFGRNVRQTLQVMVEGFISGASDYQETDSRYGVRAITICELEPDRFEQIYASALSLTMTSLLDDVEVTVIRDPDLPEPRVVDARGLHQATLDRDPVYLYIEQKDHNDGYLFRLSVMTAGGNATVLVRNNVVTTADYEFLKSLVMPFVESEGGDIKQLGLTVANVILPQALRHALLASRDRHLVIIHDAESSKIPWETLQIEEDDKLWRPAAEAGISRRFAVDLPVAKWLERRRTAEQLRILLTYNPTLDLPGTDAEARAILDLTQHLDLNIEVKSLRGNNATKANILEQLRTGKFDVFHYAGHAFFDKRDRSRSGLLCHGHEVLRGRDFSDLSSLPSLIFCNACESGRVRSGAKSRKDFQNQSNMNIGLAESLLRGGVANLIGTYWPVGDNAASIFARDFYQMVLDGKPLAPAIAESRKQLVTDADPDWADYIHYGSPDFTIKKKNNLAAG